MRLSACPNVCIPPTPPIFEQMFSTTVKSKWSVCVAFAFQEKYYVLSVLPDLGINKYYVKEVGVQASKSTPVHLFLSKATPSAEAGTPPSAFSLMSLLVSGWTGLRSRIVLPVWWFSGETSQEPACLKFSSSDGGAVVFPQDTMLEATTVHHQIKKNSVFNMKKVS